MDDVRRALEESHPLAFLLQASALLTITDPRTANPFSVGDEEAVKAAGERLVDTMMNVEQRETTALLTGLAELTPDEVLAARIRRVLSLRNDRLPRWLDRLGEGVEVYRTLEMVHVLGDGDNIMLAVRFPGGREATVAVYIDHNMGTVVKDAFVIPQAVNEVVEVMRKASGHDPDTSWCDISAADARARIAGAIDSGARTVPPFETDTWPACRPLVEWVIRMLPAGGQGYLVPDWDEAATKELAARFLASPFAEGLDDDQVDLVDTVLWFATGFGPGDPLRWSAVAVEILLIDWIPRKIVADVAYLAKAPGLLRAFIRFAHAERGIRAQLTEETLAAVDRFEPAYQRAIRSPRLQGPAALLAAAGVLDADEARSMLYDDGPLDYREAGLHRLRNIVGGEEVLDGLDGKPLPDEAFVWDGIPDDVRAAVGEVLALCDRFCDERLDVEHRTACRRFLAGAASGDPKVFRRRARPDTAAAAVCWVIGKANELFSPSGGGMLVKDLMAYFGLQGSVSQRAAVLLKAGGFHSDWYTGVVLGRSELLVSSYRRRIIERRDRFRAPLDEGRF